MRNYDANCGGKRRGCCIITDDAGGDFNGFTFLIHRLSDGTPSFWAVVPKADSKATRKRSKAIR